ncbi:MAG TPA: hypothetical protein VFV38_42180 [Ktedonobacteraceae bacterium]|nr:hypothetical protein [Ktedonobacteraceae bacterium]
MTSLLDVIRPLTEQLDNLNNKATPAITRYNQDTTQFQNYTKSSVTGMTGNIPFLGQGADACLAAVDRNASRAHHVVAKLSDFQLACDQTKKELEEMTGPFDKESLYHLGVHDLYGNLDSRNADPYNTAVADYFLLAQGYSAYDTTDLNTIIIWRIREDTLPGLSWQLDALLTPGKGQGLLEDNINYAVSCIQGDFQRFQTQRHSDLKEALQSKHIEQGAYQVYDADVDGSYNLAMHYVNVIAGKMKKGYTEWATELQTIVGQFQLDVLTASAINEPSIGDLITEVTTGPNANAKVLLWQTPNGLIVVVKGGVDAATVEQAIQQYITQHHLQGTPVTLIGYQNGGSTAQQIIRDGGQQYRVTNLVLVGAPLEDNLPQGLNTFVYQAQPKEKSEEEPTFLGLKKDQLFIPVAAVVVGLLTDGAGDFALLPALGEGVKDVGTEYAIAYGWNKAAQQWNAQHPGEPMPEMQAGQPLPIYLDAGDGNGIHQITWPEATLLANGKLPHAKIFFKQSDFVPNEPGANLNNFTNSSFLNSQFVPDPDTGRLPHGGALPAGS